jgi:hypothetical protein
VIHRDARAFNAEAQRRRDAEDCQTAHRSVATVELPGNRPGRPPRGLELDRAVKGILGALGGELLASAFLLALPLFVASVSSPGAVWR